jgi:uncharacterized protein (TIGR02172 family)
MTRNSNLPLSSSIAVGFTAEVYAWENGMVLKLFKQGISRQTVEYEANSARLVHAKGLPVPSVGGVIEFDHRYGIEYERVEGPTMLDALKQQPWRFALFARQLAELQVELHRVRLVELPSQKEGLEHKIRRAAIMPEDVRRAALQALESLPEGQSLCHGDFHPNNILLTSHGPVIIDWIDATHGSPIMDVARSTLLFGGGSLPPGTPGFMHIFQGWFYRAYLRHYSQLNPIDRQSLAHWLAVAAAARLDENITFDEPRLLSLAQRLVQPA